MVITDPCRAMLGVMSGVSDELVLDVARSPTSKWTVKAPTKRYPSVVEVMLREYEEGKRYMAVLGYDEGKEEEIDVFFPVPSVVAATDARGVLEEVCERYGHRFQLPDGPVQLVVGHSALNPAEWMNMAGMARGPFGGYLVGHYKSKDNYSVDLAFSLSFGDLLNAI